MITHREFIFFGIGIAGVVSLPGISLSKTTKKRYGMAIDLSRCLGCHSCTQACKKRYNLPLGVWRFWVKKVKKGSKVYPLPLLCNHCQNAPCITVCPTKASYRTEEGVVLELIRKVH